VISLLLSVMAVGAIFLERVMLLVLGILLILLVGFILLRPVVRNYRSRPAPEKEPAPVSGQAPSVPA
jgi:flagellar biosynthesis/type III secretory pathway M-ring protein FliF/YscJ